jgi:hypothetical protein
MQDEPLAVLIDEGNQISRMTHMLMRRLSSEDQTYDSQLKIQN